MEEDDLFVYLLEELININNNIIENTLENSVMNSSLYERNPVKRVISEQGKNELNYCKYKDAKNKDNYLFCCITQDEFKDEDDIVQLSCEHCFFPEPILKWLTEENASCPVCKKKLDSIEITTPNPIYDDSTNFYSYNFLDVPINYYDEEYDVSINLF
jgi:hypothetical protein